MQFLEVCENYILRCSIVECTEKATLETSEGVYMRVLEKSWTMAGLLQSIRQSGRQYRRIWGTRQDGRDPLDRHKSLDHQWEHMRCGRV